MVLLSHETLLAEMNEKPSLAFESMLTVGSSQTTHKPRNAFHLASGPRTQIQKFNLDFWHESCFAFAAFSINHVAIFCITPLVLSKWHNLLIKIWGWQSPVSSYPSPPKNHVSTWFWDQSIEKLGLGRISQVVSLLNNSLLIELIFLYLYIYIHTYTIVNKNIYTYISTISFYTGD